MLHYLATAFLSELPKFYLQWTIHFVKSWVSPIHKVWASGCALLAIPIETRKYMYMNKRRSRIWLSVCPSNFEHEMSQPVVHRTNIWIFEKSVWRAFLFTTFVPVLSPILKTSPGLINGFSRIFWYKYLANSLHLQRWQWICKLLWSTGYFQLFLLHFRLLKVFHFAIITLTAAPLSTPCLSQTKSFRAQWPHCQMHIAMPTLWRKPILQCDSSFPGYKMVNPWLLQQYRIFHRQLIIPPSDTIINQPPVYPVSPQNPWVNLYIHAPPTITSDGEFWYCPMLGIFPRLLTFALEIFGKGNFRKQAMCAKISYNLIVIVNEIIHLTENINTSCSCEH